MAANIQKAVQAQKPEARAQQSVNTMLKSSYETQCSTACLTGRRCAGASRSF